MASALDVTLHALAAEAANGSGAWVDMAAYRSAAILVLEVTAIGGEFRATVETSPDAVNARQAGSFEAVGDVPQKLTRKLHGLDRYVRVAWTLTTGATFKLAGQAHQVYADESDVRSEVPARLIDSASADEIADGLIKASSDMESALASGTAVTMPLTAWPESVRQKTATIAAYRIMKAKGYQPESPDELIVSEHKAAQTWLCRVRSGDEKPLGTTPTLGTTVHTYTQTKRGW